MPNFIDGDDLRLIAQGAVYVGLAVIVLLILAGAAGLAWMVFRLAGGL